MDPYVSLPLFFLFWASSPHRQSNTSAAKKRADLLDSFDTLSSHLVTTFTALSCALAQSTTSSRRRRRRRPGTHRDDAYLAFLVGPSIGSARSKVVLALDGLEVNIWGTRNDRVVGSGSGNGSEGEDCIGSGTGSDAEDAEGVPESDDDEDENDEDDEDESDESDDDEDENPELCPTPPSYAAEQQAFRVAERTLSLALANADGEGHGMSAELGT